MSAYPMAIILAILAAVVVLLDIPPFIWHAKHRNLAPALLIGCTIVANILSCANAIIWRNDDITHWFDGNVYCDIHAKFTAGFGMEIPAAIFVVLKGLAAVMNTENIIMIPTKAQKRRTLIIDLSICIGLPILAMFLHWICQSLRYAIVGIVGCNPVISWTWLSFCLTVLPPLLLTTVDVYLAGLIVYRMRRYRVRFNSLLSAASTSKSYFYRLLALCICLIFIFLPLEIVTLTRIWTRKPDTFTWSEAHSPTAWKLIPMLPSFGDAAFVDRWLQLVAGVLMFIFFGLGRDARTMYAAWLAKIGIAGASLSAFKSKSKNVMSRGSRTDSQASFVSKAQDMGLSKQSTDKSIISTSTAEVKLTRLSTLGSHTDRNSHTSDRATLPTQTHTACCTGPAQSKEAVSVPLKVKLGNAFPYRIVHKDQVGKDGSMV